MNSTFAGTATDYTTAVCRRLRLRRRRSSSSTVVLVAVVSFFRFLFFLDKQAPLKQENSALLWTAYSPMPGCASVKEGELNTREKWSFYVWR